MGNHPSYCLHRVLEAGAGTVEYPPGGRFGPRLQPDYQLVSVHKGSMEVYLDGVPRLVPEGHITLLKPGVLEEFRFDRAVRTWHRWIWVRLAEWECPDLSATPYIPLSDEMVRMIDLMVLLDNGTRTPYRDDCLKALGSSALYLYLSECQINRTARISNPVVSTVISYIHEHYQSELTLTDMAQAAAISKEHLVRLFRLSRGTTPVKYLWSYRLDKAVGLICNTGLSMKDIADQTGFHSPYHFSKAIKGHTGLAPTQLRHGSPPGRRSGASADPEDK
ncbi:helix-turn-helix domain-containing protein [Gorillibacterium sp. sgz5001074]|uniref:helix-turn-helix domain-containing protein n=1 Tax=Gorillibacterium sp. sgz5001074 TaxID=3446695 RepID=UPI003F677B5F